MLATAVLIAACSPATPATRGGPLQHAVELTMTDEWTFEPARIDELRGDSVRFVGRKPATSVGMPVAVRKAPSWSIAFA